MPKDDDLLPKKSVKKPASKGSSSKGPSPQMVRLMRINLALGLLAGGFVSLVYVMALVGKATDSFLIRFVVALVIVVGIPALIADRLLKKTGGGGLGLVGEVYAIVLLGIGLLVTGAEFATKDTLLREGDRYAESGSRGMARVVYFVAGVNPVFPNEKSAAPKNASGSAQLDAGVK